MPAMLSDRGLALIGGGNMGEAIMKGLIAANLVKPQDITVTDVIEARLIYLRETYGVRSIMDNAKAAAQAELIILAVKPQDVVPTIQGMAAAVDDQKVVVSIAAGVPTGKIEAAFGKPVRVVRVMPNTPALVLADGGVKVGLPRDVALTLAAQTVYGAAKLLLETGLHPAELKDRVASPAGTTIAGLQGLEERAFRAAVIDAVERATLRSRELGR